MFRSRLLGSKVSARVFALLGLGAVSLGLAGEGLPEALLRRWSDLTSSRQAELRDQWSRFRNLTDREQQDLLEFHEILREARQKVLQSLPDAERARIKELDLSGRHEALKPYLSEWLKSEERRVAEPLLGDPTFMEGGKVQLSALQEAARMRAAAKLHELEQDGLLEPGVAEPLYDLPPWKLMKALRSIRKQATISRPPKWFRSLPAEEKAELKGLSPEAFAAKVRELRGKPGRRNMDKVMEQLFGPKETGRQEIGRLLKQLSQGPGSARANLMKVHLTPEQQGSLAGLHGKERKIEGMRHLRSNAEGALSRRGVPGDEIAAIFRQLEGLPLKARLPYLVRLIQGKSVDPGKARRSGGKNGGKHGRKGRGKQRP